MKKSDFLKKAILTELPHNRLYSWVVNDIMARVEDDGEKRTMRDKIEIMYNYANNVAIHGCSSGIVHNLITYKDTNFFFLTFEKEILELLGAASYFSTTNLTLCDYFTDRTYVNNMFAWAAYEIIAGEVAAILAENFISVAKSRGNAGAPPRMIREATRK